MSARLVISLVLASILAFGAGAGVGLWAVMHPEEGGAPVPAAQSPSDAERSEHREKFFSGDPDRDVRGGQEMKPRW